VNVKKDYTEVRDYDEDYTVTYYCKECEEEKRALPRRNVKPSMEGRLADALEMKV